MTGEIIPRTFLEPDSATLPVQRRERAPETATLVGAGDIALGIEVLPDGTAATDPTTPETEIGVTNTTEAMDDTPPDTDINPFIEPNASQAEAVEPDTDATQTTVPTPKPEPGDAASTTWELIEKAQGGDMAAFAKIYDLYSDTIFRFIFFRVGSRPLAEDLTADTFLRGLNRIGSFTWQGRDIGAWFVTIARNLVADHFKSGRYRLEVTTGDVIDVDRPSTDRMDNPAQAAVDYLTNIRLLEAVKQLNEEQQECIVLRFLQGLSVAETAQAMKRNEGAVKALQYRAVRNLRGLLPEGFTPW